MELSSLDLAGRTVRESLRLHPAGVIGVRQATRDVTLAGYLVPRGTLIAWSPYLAGRDARAWPNPMEFDPDRHLDPSPQQRELAKVAWVPFGGGSRGCIGFALAQMELTIILARLAQRIRLSPASNELPSPVGMVVNRPRGGARVAVSPR